MFEIFPQEYLAGCPRIPEVLSSSKPYSSILYNIL